MHGSLVSVVTRRITESVAHDTLWNAQCVRECGAVRGRAAGNPRSSINVFTTDYEVSSREDDHSHGERGEREIQTELTTMMPKGDTIAEIMKLNPTADPGFLSEFSNDELSDYLDRLANAHGAATCADVLHKTHPDPMLPDRAAVQSSTFSINAPGISCP